MFDVFLFSMRFVCLVFLTNLPANTILELHVITSWFTRIDKPNKFFSDNLRGVICYSKANLVMGDPKQDLLKSIFPGGSPWDGFAALFFLTDCQTLIINLITVVWFNVGSTLRFEMPVLLVYVLDPRYFCTSPFGVPRTGPFRQRFLLDAWCFFVISPKKKVE